jgi:hypothetical protein
MLRKVPPLLWIAAIAAALWLVFPYGFPTYDTRYALVWGNEMAHGIGPDYGAGQPPTPHPLADLWGAVVSPLGPFGAGVATTVVAYLAIAATGYLVYRLAARWFDRPIGLVAALLVLTRPPIIANGTRCYVDLPYMALVLAALAVESRRPRSGWPVLALLAVAGLLRPETWLFSAAYLAYLLVERDPERGRLGVRLRAALNVGRVAPLVVLAASAPLLWASFDVATTGDPLYSFTATRDRVQTLERSSGPGELVTGAPHRLGEVMGRPGLLAAAAGLLLAFFLLRRRGVTGIVATFLAGLAFAILACVGLAVIARYLMLTSALLCIFSAVALLGWRLLPAGDPWRRRWIAFAVVLAGFFAVEVPLEYGYLSDERSGLAEEQKLDSELRHLADSGALRQGCSPITVPSDRAVPRLAAWLDVRPSTIAIYKEQPPPTRGYFLDPITSAGALHYQRNPVPARFRPVARNDSWLLYARCVKPMGKK